MPELPEVETTLKGISPFLKGAELKKIVVRQAQLRWRVPTKKLQQLCGNPITSVQRRAKYLLIESADKVILIHLGMSGSLRVLDPSEAVGKHDHIDIVVTTKSGADKIIRYNDPRRFGCCLLLDKPAEQHKLLSSLGPEPLTEIFDGDYLYQKSRARSLSAKQFIMDNKVVVGVGNIYASEALFMAGIRPTRAAKQISRKCYHALADAIKHVLSKAIKAGGTTLNDFSQTDGKPGYFQQELQVYGRDGESCNTCSGKIKSAVIGQRNTYFCTQCQR